jgi:hypothetical protein
MVLLALTLIMSASMAIGNVANASVSGSTAHIAHTTGERSAQAASSSFLCANYGDTSQCLNPANGSLSDGNTIDVTGANYTVVTQFICVVGYTAGECQPFASGSNCNSRYKGDGVFGIVWTNTVSAVRDYTASNDQVKVSDTTDFNAEWVISGHWIINVGATNNANVNCDTGNPFILTYRPNTGTVWTRSGGSYDAAKQNWDFVA